MDNNIKKKNMRIYSGGIPFQNVHLVSFFKTKQKRFDKFVFPSIYAPLKMELHALDY